MKSYIMLAVKVEGDPVEALDEAHQMVRDITDRFQCEVIVLNTVPADG